MASKRFSLVAIATIFSGLLIPLTLNNGILSLLPEWILDYHLYVLSTLSVFCGLMLWENKFPKLAIVFTFPLLMWTLFSINIIYINGYLIAFGNYFTLWLMVVVYMYRIVYNKDLWIKTHQWIGIQIMILSGLIVFGNPSVGALIEA